MIESCRVVGIDAHLYLNNVLVRVATHKASQVGELIPARWRVLFGASASV